MSVTEHLLFIVSRDKIWQGPRTRPRLGVHWDVALRPPEALTEACRVLLFILDARTYTSHMTKPTGKTFKSSSDAQLCKSIEIVTLNLKTYLPARYSDFIYCDLYFSTFWWIVNILDCAESLNRFDMNAAMHVYYCKFMVGCDIYDSKRTCNSQIACQSLEPVNKHDRSSVCRQKQG